MQSPFGRKLIYHINVKSSVNSPQDSLWKLCLVQEAVTLHLRHSWAGMKISVCEKLHHQVRDLVLNGVTDYKVNFFFQNTYLLVTYTFESVHKVVGCV